MQTYVCVVAVCVLLGAVHTQAVTVESWVSDVQGDMEELRTALTSFKQAAQNLASISNDWQERIDQAKVLKNNARQEENDELVQQLNDAAPSLRQMMRQQAGSADDANDAINEANLVLEAIIEHTPILSAPTDPDAGTRQPFNVHMHQKLILSPPQFINLDAYEYTDLTRLQCVQSCHDYNQYRSNGGSVCVAVNFQYNGNCYLIFDIQLVDAHVEETVQWDYIAIKSVEWTPVFRMLPGSGDNVLSSWTSGEPINEQLGSPGTITPEDAPVYLSVMATHNWNNINWIRLSFYDGNNEASFTTFETTNADKLSWMTRDRIYRSTYTDITAEPHLPYFSVTGYDVSGVVRRFDAIRNHGGCPNDSGWWWTTDNEVCGVLVQDTYPRFYYSSLSTHQRSQEWSEATEFRISALTIQNLLVGSCGY